MENIRKTFILNFVSLVVAILIVAVIPLSKGYFWLQLILVALFVLSYISLAYFIARVVRHCENDISHLEDLKFLLITILFVFATIYFLLASFDKSQSMLSGFRGYPGGEFAIDGVVPLLNYIQGLLLTYFNSLYYSVVVMATLGDSGMSVTNIVPRMFVAAQLTITYSLIVFKLSEYFNSRAELAAKESEDRIVKSMRSKSECTCCCSQCEIRKPRKIWRISSWLK